MRQHQLYHTGEKRYKCDVCEKKFTTGRHLKTHMTVHTGERAFKCEICYKQFSQSGNLKIHEKIHTRKFPFLKKQVNVKIDKINCRKYFDVQVQVYKEIEISTILFT